MEGEADAPVLAVLLASVKKKADESIPDTKGRESWTPKHFPLQIGSFLGTATVAMMAIADPSGWHPFAASGAVVVGEGHAPVVGVLLAVCQIQAGPAISPSRGQPELATGRFPRRRAVTNEPV